MTVHKMPSLTPRAAGDLVRAADEVRLLLASTTTVAEAYLVWQFCRELGALMEALTVAAAHRCDELSEAKNS